MMKKAVSLIIALIISILPLASCTADNSGDGAHILSFSQSPTTKEMMKLEGKEVSIIGYMSTLMPDSGGFMYLMNMPYQSCPYCVPNNTSLANTIAVCAQSGSSFEFTDLAIQVTGILEFGSYTDQFGYEYNYRIKDAVYTALGVDDLDSSVALWQKLASAGVVAEVYRMYEYVNFLCSWPTYTAKFEKGTDYIYPSDVVSFCQADGSQYNYGYKEGYFDSIIAETEVVSETDFTALVENIRKAEALAEQALAELNAGNYTALTEYSGTFGDGRTQYKLNRSVELEALMQQIYAEFAAWLATWEI